MDSDTAYVRRNYYIKKDFQKRFMIEYFMLVVLGVILTNWILYTVLTKEIETAFYKAHIAITTTGDVVRSPLVLTSIAVVFMSIAAVTTSMFFNSWGIGKRLNCLSEGMEYLKNGDLTVQVKTCRGKELKEAADIFNSTVMQLNKKITAIKDGVISIEDTAMSLETDRTGSVEQLQKRIYYIEEYLLEFKLRQ